MDELILVIAGTRYVGWEEIGIKRSMEQGPHEFDLKLTNAWRSSNHRSIKRGFPCTVFCDNELLITGSIDDVEPEYDATNQTLTVRGRSRVGDLVDCSLQGKQFQNQRLDAIAREICKPFGVDILVETDIGDAFPSAVLDAGQSPWEFLDSLARMRAVRLLGDEQGRLILTRLSGRLAETSLVLGKNIRKASGSFSCRDQYSEYTIASKNGSQRSFSSSATAKSIAHVSARVLDESVPRYRPLFTVADEDGHQGDCHSMANWQRNTHKGRGEQIVYTVDSWRERPGGKVWMPNTRVMVEDAYQDTRDERVIVEARLRVKVGRYAELMVLPSEALEREPLAPKKKKRSAQWGSV